MEKEEQAADGGKGGVDVGSDSSTIASLQVALLTEDCLVGVLNGLRSASAFFFFFFLTHNLALSLRLEYSGAIITQCNLKLLAQAMPLLRLHK